MQKNLKVKGLGKANDQKTKIMQTSKGNYMEQQQHDNNTY